MVVESDLPIIYNIEPSNIAKLKQLVAYICNSKPYELNLTNLATKIGINRKTLYLYIHYLTVGDIFLKVLPKYRVEIGGKNKSFKQIKDMPNSFVVADDIEVGFGAKIPLWLFGFLY